MVRKIIFEDAWRAYVNAPDDVTEQKLRVCLRAASTFAQARQVYNAAFNTVDTENVRSPALRKMIELAADKEEAAVVQQVACKKVRGKIRYPALAKRAKLKLDSFDA